MLKSKQLAMKKNQQQQQQQQQSGGIFRVLQNSLGAIFLGNMLASKGDTASKCKRQGVKRPDDRFIRAGKGSTVRGSRFFNAATSFN